MQTVCVFCGSRSGDSTRFGSAAKAVGEAIARSGMRLVYGGGRIGLMGVVADAALAAGGEVIGVIPESLQAREVGHAGLSELHVVPSMHLRKALMAELSDGFIALPGGIGTLEELFEVWTWAQLGLHDKPLGLLNVAGFYDGLLAFLDTATGHGFLDPDTRSLLHLEENPASLLAAMSSQPHVLRPRWLQPDQT